MGWLIVIALCLLYFVVLGGAQLYIWIRMALDGERPRWMVEVSGVLACTPEAAFALVGDPRNDARYAPQVVAVALDAPGELRVGATYRETIRIGPTTGTFDCTITAYDPPRAIDTRATFARRPLFGGYRVEPHPDGCVLTSRSGSTWTAAGIALGGLARLLTRRACRTNLGRIRAVLEAPVRATGGPDRDPNIDQSAR